ncbi:MAG: UDP-N-acetylmuramate--L-alanine ligase [Chitinivibrionales bacterium]|nr:UDP-N-acetylmuramate--L-alanine ligase [Chitinivibrionales bacterium]
MTTHNINHFFGKQRIHFIGIGGAGMCPMAEIVSRQGFAVSGSDQLKSAMTQHLESLGIPIQYSHVPDLIKGASLCVYSSAVKSENEEMHYAVSSNIRCMKRAEMLGDLMRSTYSIAVAGTHGKTTTTALLATIFTQAGFAPTALVGGVVAEFDSNAIVGSGGLLITEADEYDRSFLSMFPTIAVITNIEVDHLDIYKDLQDITSAFREFIDRVPFYGSVFLGIDDSQNRALIPAIGRTCITYGLAPDATYRAESIRHTGQGMEFTAYRRSECLGPVTVSLQGIHNVANACGAIGVATELNVPFSQIQSSLRQFRGVKRRFDIIAEVAGVTVIDDYAHHPSEIRATLTAAQKAGYRRIVAVFQPHLYSRTRDFYDGFASSLALADIALVTQIYKAREEAITSVSADVIVEKMRLLGHRHCFFVAFFDELIEEIASRVNPGDAVVIMGAGDIWRIALPLTERIGRATQANK